MVTTISPRQREDLIKRINRLYSANGHKNPKRTGGQIVIEALIRNGITDVFGIPGGANLPLYDAIPKYSKAGLLNHYLTGQEGGAAHASEGYALASGKLAPCFGTSGPGATNLVTGIQDARMDSVPLLAVTGQVPRALIGTDAFQETPIKSVTDPITKYSFLVKDENQLAEIMQMAMYLATTGRHGPVLVDLPKDVAAARTTANWLSEEEIKNKLNRSYNPYPKSNLSRLEKAVNTIKKSKRPVLYVGGGIISAEAWDELYQFATENKIPVIPTFKALGSFPATHELYTGPPGMHGTIASNYALNLSDCVIALGTRFDDRVTGKLSEFAKKAKIIHIEIDSSEINKVRKADIPINCDVKTALRPMIELSRKKRHDYSEWLEQIKKWKEGWPTTYKVNSNGKIAPQYVIERLYELTKNLDTIITTGVGQHQMYTTQFYKFTKPRTFISSLGSATMGFGLPAAIGAQVARPDALVVDIDGDGSFNMNPQELRVLGRYGLPVKVIILDNKYLGMVDQWQKRFHKKNRSEVDTGYGKYPDFTTIAEGYGVAGRIISKPNQVIPALEKMLKHNGPYVLHIPVDKKAEVYPILGSGEPWMDIAYPFKKLPKIPKY